MRQTSRIARGVRGLEHDMFIELMQRKNTLRRQRGEGVITQLGFEYCAWELGNEPYCGGGMSPPPQ